MAVGSVRVCKNDALIALLCGGCCSRNWTGESPTCPILPPAGKFFSVSDCFDGLWRCGFSKPINQSRESQHCAVLDGLIVWHESFGEQAGEKEHKDGIKIGGNPFAPRPSSH